MTAQRAWSGAVPPAREALTKSYGPKTGFGGLMIMADPNEPVHVTATEARAGATPGVARYVLGISLVLVIAIFAFLILR